MYPHTHTHIHTFMNIREDDGSMDEGKLAIHGGPTFSQHCTYYIHMYMCMNIIMYTYSHTHIHTHIYSEYTRR